MVYQKIKGSNQKKQEIIQKVLNELNPEERMIFSMHFKDEKTINEIAEKLNISYKEAASVLQSSKNKVNAAIKEQEEKDNLKIGAFSPLGFFAVLLKGWKPEADPSTAARISTIITEGYDPAEFGFKEQAKIQNKTNLPKHPAAPAAGTAGSASTATGIATTSFIASTAGKIVLTAAIGIAVGMGGTYTIETAKERNNTETAFQSTFESVAGEDEHWLPFAHAEEVTEITDPSMIVWTSEPGILDVDDFYNFFMSVVVDLDVISTGVWLEQTGYGTSLGKYYKSLSKNGFIDVKEL